MKEVVVLREIFFHYNVKILLNVLQPPFSTLNSWLNWVDEDDDEDEVGLKEKPEDTRYIKNITSK